VLRLKSSGVPPAQITNPELDQHMIDILSAAGWVVSLDGPGECIVYAPGFFLIGGLDEGN